MGTLNNFSMGLVGRKSGLVCLPNFQPLWANATFLSRAGIISLQSLPGSEVSDSTSMPSLRSPMWLKPHEMKKWIPCEDRQHSDVLWHCPRANEEQESHTDMARIGGGAV